MKTKLQTRYDKVRFLSDLAAGKVSVQDITPINFANCKVWMRTGELLQNGDEILTDAEFRERYKKENTIVFK